MLRICVLCVHRGAWCFCVGDEVGRAHRTVLSMRFACDMSLMSPRRIKRTPQGTRLRGGGTHNEEMVTKHFFCVIRGRDG
jgi:hypothetical protein